MTVGEKLMRWCIITIPCRFIYFHGLFHRFPVSVDQALFNRINQRGMACNWNKRVSRYILIMSVDQYGTTVQSERWLNDFSYCPVVRLDLLTISTKFATVRHE